MAEAVRDVFRGPDAPARAGARPVNGGAPRWTPGPDELRLPSREDEPVSQNSRQFVVLEESAGSLRLHWRGRRDVFVGADQFVYWNPAHDGRANPGNAPAAPDLYVAFGVANRHRGSYVVWEEGKPPDFVLEVASPSSRRRDGTEKLDVYAEMGVPEYFWYDPEGKLEPALAGFGLSGGGYAPLPEETLPGGLAGVRSEVLGLCLCVEPAGPEPLDVALRWYDPAAGAFLPTRHEWEARAKQEAQRRKAVEAQAAQEAARRKAAEARVAELEAALRRSRQR